MRTVVGVSDVHVSAHPGDEIITYALGSCLGIAVYDPYAGVGGLLHVMLPLAKSDPEKAKMKPAMYVDTGLSLLLDRCYALGASKKNLVISVAGGASMKKNDEDDYFKIGKRNFTTLRKLLWKNGFMIEHQDVGGNKSRTMTLRLSDGLVTINKQPIGSGSTPKVGSTGTGIGCQV
ncbi:chemotaxis protein CheD [Rhodohalobacter sp. SW132]|uniref:chemotaxis protein CheD n=1 Tax=Rhodohalobacter sp. SW132 TaxID=2293433 RepID=UPI000E22D26D|nr:chemotaxis protein CheD [Rhodohalobacter sp. SW132]REL38704.1 chemotaxis protein CheD [Rhodohalobacter sp. SW132]